MTKDNSDEKRWRSIRLRSWDYRNAGAYFLTFVTHNREALFGEVVNGNMVLSRGGETVQEEWFVSAKIRPEIKLDVFVIMPNHVHGIVWLENSTLDSPAHSAITRLTGPTAGSLGAFVAGFKAAVTRRINAVRNTPEVPV